MAGVTEQQGVDEKFSDDSEIAKIEREGVKELAAVARGVVAKLPSSSRWREPFIDISDLDAVDRIEESHRRLTGDAPQAYAESIASRGKKNAEDRARLSDSLFDANWKLAVAGEELRESLCCVLEGSPTDYEFGAAETALDEALSSLGDARRAAVHFLRGEGELDGPELAETMKGGRS
jgi:hypothetical protein